MAVAVCGPAAMTLAATAKVALCPGASGPTWNVSGEPRVRVRPADRATLRVVPSANSALAPVLVTVTVNTDGAHGDVHSIASAINAALEAFKSLGIDPPCVISLAKQEEEIFRPGEAESIKLSHHSAALRLVQYVRDEAHRFAQHYHHMLRKKRTLGEDEG